jgi:hypothetical protein
MSGTPEHIKEKSRLLKQKVAVIKEALLDKALAELPFQELEGKASAILESKGMTSMNHNTLRDLRHAARKKHGLPFDGINYPETRSRDSGFRARLGVAYEVAREKGGNLTHDQLRAEVKKRLNNGRSIGTEACRMVLAKVNREVARQHNGQAALTLVPSRPTVADRMAAAILPGNSVAQVEATLRDITRVGTPVKVEVPPDTLSPDALAALELLIPTLNADRIVHLVLVLSPTGKWEWAADRKQKVGGSL